MCQMQNNLWRCTNCSYNWDGTEDIPCSQMTHMLGDCGSLPETWVDRPYVCDFCRDPELRLSPRARARARGRRFSSLNYFDDGFDNDEDQIHISPRNSPEPFIEEEPWLDHRRSRRSRNHPRAPHLREDQYQGLEFMEERPWDARRNELLNERERLRRFNHLDRRRAAYRRRNDGRPSRRNRRAADDRWNERRRERRQREREEMEERNRRSLGVSRSASPRHRERDMPPPASGGDGDYNDGFADDEGPEGRRGRQLWWRTIMDGE